MNNATTQDLLNSENFRNPFDAENRKYTLKVTCSWCLKDLGTKPCSAKMDGKVSHGICPECENRYFWMQSA